MIVSKHPVVLGRPGSGWGPIHTSETMYDLPLQYLIDLLSKKVAAPLCLLLPQPPDIDKACTNLFTHPIVTENGV